MTIPQDPRVHINPPAGTGLPLAPWCGAEPTPGSPTGPICPDCWTLAKAHRSDRETRRERTIPIAGKNYSSRPPATTFEEAWLRPRCAECGGGRSAQYPCICQDRETAAISEARFNREQLLPPEPDHVPGDYR